jgi:hypothetical protein
MSLLGHSGRLVIRSGRGTSLGHFTDRVAGNLGVSKIGSSVLTRISRATIYWRSTKAWLLTCSMIAYGCRGVHPVDGIDSVRWWQSSLVNYPTVKSNLHQPTYVYKTNSRPGPEACGIFDSLRTKNVLFALSEATYLCLPLPLQKEYLTFRVDLKLLPRRSRL